MESVGRRGAVCRCTGLVVRREQGRDRLADVGRVAGSQHGLRRHRPADHVGRQDRQEHQVGRVARIPELRQSRRRQRRRARGHEQRSHARSETAGRSRRADGVPRIDRRVPVAGDVRKTAVGPRQRLALPGHRVVAAHHRREGVLHVEPRRPDGRGHPRLSRQRERRTVQGREADRQDGHGRALDVRHDGGSRQLPAQPREFIADVSRQPDLHLDRQRTGREPREHSVAQGAGDRRDRHEHRQARLGRCVARRQDPARSVVHARGWHDRRRAAGRARPGRRLGARLRGEDAARSSGSSTRIPRTPSGRRRATK